MLILLTLCFVEGCNQENGGEAQDHLEKGVEYFKKGEYEKSALELKTSSQADKNTAETYYYLALLDEKNRQFKAMKDNLIKSIELEPTRTEARVKLGKLQLLFGDFNAAMEQVQALLKDSPQNQDALLLKASVLTRQSKQGEALAIINELLKNNPNFVDALTLKAAIVGMDSGKLDEAVDLMNAAIKNDNKNIELHLFKLQLNHKRKNNEAVIEGYKELIKLYPDRIDFKVALAREYSQNNRAQDAEALLKQLADNEKNDTKLKFLFLSFLSDINQAKADEQFHLYTEQFKDQPSLLLKLSQWMIVKRNFSEAKKMLNRVVELEDDSGIALSAKTLLAKIALESRDINKAQAIVDEILQVNSNYNDAKILLARLLLIQKKYSEATTQLTEVTWNLPNSEEALQLLGQIALITGDQKQADKYFKNILEINPGNTEAILFAQNNALAKNDVKSAQAILEKGLTVNPNNLTLLEKIVKLNLHAKNWDAANATIQKIAQIPTEAAKDLARFLTAESFKDQKNCAKANSLFKEMLLQFPDNSDILQKISQCYEAQNQRAEAIKFFGELVGKNPGNWNTNSVLGQLLIKAKQFDQATKLLDNFKTNTFPDKYLLLAELKLAQNDVQGAIAAYREGIDQNPENIALALALADRYQQQGDFSLAVAQYEAILTKYQHYDIATNRLASLLIDHFPEKIDRAVQLSEKFKESNSLNYLDTYAWALTKQGTLSEAIPIFNKIITLAPEEPIYRYHLGFAQQKMGNTAIAIAELSQSIELSKQTGDIQIKQAAERLLNEVSNQTK